jgi:5-methylcytosine-specific restriction endonuclease McrA
MGQFEDLMREIALDDFEPDGGIGFHQRTPDGDRMAGHPEHRRVTMRNAYMALGGKCCYCGNDDWNVLEIDHVNGDGKLERAQVAKDRMLREIANAKDNTKSRYQLLCANCHRKKTAQQLKFKDKNALKTI